MAPDRPLQERVRNGILFGFKKLLVSWAFEPMSVYVNVENGTLLVEGNPVYKVSVEGYELTTTWLDDAWQQWKEAAEDESYLKLIKDAREKLAAGKARVSKGSGKSAGGGQR